MTTSIVRANTSTPGMAVVGDGFGGRVAAYTSTGVAWLVIGDYRLEPRLYRRMPGSTVWELAHTLPSTVYGSMLSNSDVIEWRIFIDADDWMHLLPQKYAQDLDPKLVSAPITSDGTVVDFTGRTAYSLTGSADSGYTPFIVHRVDENTRMVHFLRCSLAANYVYYGRASMDNDGVVTRILLGSSSSGGGVVNGGTNLNDTQRSVNIDFHHIGDGKTVKDGTPHVYVVGSAASGNGLRCWRAMWNGTTWVTDAALGSQISTQTPNSGGLAFDGTELLYVGSRSDSTDQGRYYRYNPATLTKTEEQALPTYSGGNAYIKSTLLYHPPNGKVYVAQGLDGSPWSADNRIHLMDRDANAGGAFSARTQLDLTAYGAAGQIEAAIAAPAYSFRDTDIVWARNTVATNNNNDVYADTVAVSAGPTANLTAPADASQVDPRLPVAVTWSAITPVVGTARYQLRWRELGTTAWQTIVETTATSYTIPADSIPDELDIELAVLAYDGGVWSAPDAHSIAWNSWLPAPEVLSAATSGSLDTTGLEPGIYELAVHVADDQVGYGPLSQPVTFEIIGTNVQTMVGGVFQPTPRFVRVAGVWQTANPAKVPV